MLSWFVIILSFWSCYENDTEYHSFMALTSAHIFKNNFGDHISCCRSCLYLSTIPLSTPLLPSFPSISQWLSPIFNFHSFTVLTTTNLFSIQDSTSPCPSFDKVKVYAFTNNDDSIPLTTIHAICDPTYPVSEPNFNSSDGIFDEWFGILFSTDTSFTHIWTPHFTEILTLYRIDTLIPLHPTITSSAQIRSLILHTITFHIMQ